MTDRPVTPGDAQLVAAVRRGDSAAADALVRRHYRSAFAVALALLGNPMDAEDVCQEAFVRALDRLEECRHPDRFAFWLLRIVRNQSHNAREYRRVRSGPPLDEVERAGPDDSQRDAAAAQLGQRLIEALQALTPAQREVILLKDLEGWDHRAIAELLNISEGMSRQHAFAARKALRQRLGADALREYLE